MSLYSLESSRAEFSYLRVLTDADSFDKVANDEEAYDSPWDEDDSSESREESTRKGIRSVSQAWNQTYRRKQK